MRGHAVDTSPTSSASVSPRTTASSPSDSGEDPSSPQGRRRRRREEEDDDDDDDDDDEEERPRRKVRCTTRTTVAEQVLELIQQHSRLQMQRTQSMMTLASNPSPSARNRLMMYAMMEASSDTTNLYFLVAALMVDMGLI